MRHTAYISLGSNYDAAENLKRAIFRLGQKTHLLAVSPVYESMAEGEDNKKANNYLNAAACIISEDSAPILKAAILKTLEKELGRDRSTAQIVSIDLDLVLFNQYQFTIANLTIPDNSILKYLYVARPLADIAPQYVHPVTKETLLEIAQRLESENKQQLLLREDIDIKP